ncbi:MAG: hypothetical protein NTW29_16660 [Bacteroidetes bacterium]|nr:hypothetical protein [Bacteroidota bacterium]
MSAALQTAIENLYSVFSVYTPRPFMEGCPCCVSGAEKEQLHAKPLQVLTEDDLSRYAFKAMTTWGDLYDFKHFLPRIFQLASTSGFIVDTFVLLDKLAYGKWQEWAETEKEAVRQFLLAWWSDAIEHHSSFDKELYLGIIDLTNDTHELLRQWTIRFTDNSFSNLVDLVYNHYHDLFEKKKGFSPAVDLHKKQLHAWLKEKAEILEKGFFYFADKDPAFAERISAAQFIIEKA